MYAIRHAIVSKIVTVYAHSFWEANGQNGSSYNETAHFGGTWSQRNGILSALVPPERHTPFLATPAHLNFNRNYWPAWSRPSARKLYSHKRCSSKNGVWTPGPRVTSPPGDLVNVMRVGPLHSTHESPFYVCGSDQWVCGYMVGAIRSGL
ncbi:hypothetical protein BN970_03527 [Mycolicibacterium conceptionense]|nr:hypothetical protein BN970_03527 [Mycolicibacterium conceptionense]